MLVAAIHGDQQGWQPGIERRVDPAIDAEIRPRRDRFVPVERGADPLAPFGAGHEQARRRGHHDPGAQGVGVAPGHAGTRQPHPQSSDRLGGPALMQCP
jgi:hypothetical protein